MEKDQATHSRLPPCKLAAVAGGGDGAHTGEAVDKSATSTTPESRQIIPLETRYQTSKEMLLAVLERQYSYGRWLLASLLTVHAGSLLAISQAGSVKEALYKSCGPLLIYGVAATLTAGGLAWVNYSVIANACAFAMKDLRDGREPTPTTLKKVLAGLTFWVTPFVASVSLGLFIAAAWRAMDVFAKALPSALPPT
ncbi:hypothetical protein [Hyphomicrobium sp. CS1BSMeth3]|uniref:hypothetical protein n=1 Tax=Hyphomicrobium sp. CS1BSMeth3 TaxID=1892844 RepID=UPI000A7555F5|nr:hypothetical protein [Hyphomicrobium sp. CS1BSMeth3]